VKRNYFNVFFCIVLQNVQGCDATKAETSNTAGKQKIADCSATRYLMLLKRLTPNGLMDKCVSNPASYLPAPSHILVRRLFPFPAYQWGNRGRISILLWNLCGAQ